MDVMNVTDVMHIMNSSEVNSTIPHDPVNICILKYSDHPSIKLIRENEQFVNPSTSSEKIEIDIERGVLTLNLQKSGTFSIIQTKVIKYSFDACNLALEDKEFQNVSKTVLLAKFEVN